MEANSMNNNEFFNSAKIKTILFKIAPPVMLAQLIQALYNIVDSFFVGKYSNNAQTALAVIYPLQLVIIALAVGTGVGVNTYMARKYAKKQDDMAKKTAGMGILLAFISWFIFAILSFLLMKSYVKTSCKDEEAIQDAIIYGNIVCIGSLASFLEGVFSKIHQSKGNMRLPMIAQVAGAVTNIVLDPLLIFGKGPFPELGIAGAAYATIIGQLVSSIIVGITAFSKPPKGKEMLFYTKKIYFYGYSNILMQLLYTVYIVALNMILAQFTDAAVTVLGLYYKLQSFFFIPLFGLQTCIVPLISYNYARKNYERVHQTMKDTFYISLAFMVLGFICFVFFPTQFIGFFSHNEEVLEVGKVAFPIIGASFFMAVFSLTMPVFFQAIGKGKVSALLSLTRQIFCLIPIFYLFSLIGLNYTWISFPLSELISGGIGLILYRKELHQFKIEEQKEEMTKKEE